MKKKGQSLIETLVYIAMMALFINLAIPYIDSYINGGSSAKVQSETASIANDIIRYKYHTGKYPENLKQLETNIGTYSASSKVPDSDPWGQAYMYQYKNDVGFAVWSPGENKSNDSSNACQDGFKKDDIGTIGK